MQKHVHLVDLAKSFPTNIYLQSLASIQPRTSPVKFAWPYPPDWHFPSSAPRPEVVLEFEASGSWPSDAEAVQHVKAALLLQMKTELETELGLESRVAGPPQPFLDVLAPDSIWRLRIFHPHELIGAAAKIRSEVNSELNFSPNFEGLVLGCIDADFCK